MFFYLFTGFYSVMKVIRLYSLSSKLGGPLSLGALGGRPLRLCLTPLLLLSAEFDQKLDVDSRLKFC